MCARTIKISFGKMRWPLVRAGADGAAGAGMASAEAGRDNRRMDAPERTRRLLGIIAALLAAHLVLLVAALGFLAWKAAPAFRAIDAASQDVKRSQQILQEIREERARLGTELDEVARKTGAKLAEVDRRRAALEGVRKGPVAKLDQMIELNQVIAVNLVLLLDHLVSTQGVLAQEIRRNTGPKGEKQ